MDVNTAYGYSVSRYHWIQCHVRPYGWRYVSFSLEEDSIEEDLHFARKVAWQKFSKDYTEVTPMTGRLVISPHILDPFWKQLSFGKGHKVMDIYPDDETSYTTQYQEAFLQYMGNEYCAIYQPLSLSQPEMVPSNNLFFSTTVFGSGLSSIHPNDLSSGDKRILNASQCVHNNSRAKRLHTMLVDSRNALFEFSTRISKELRANWSES